MKTIQREMEPARRPFKRGGKLSPRDYELLAVGQADSAHEFASCDREAGELLVREGFAVPVSKCLWRLTEKGLKHVRS